MDILTWALVVIAGIAAIYVASSAFGAWNWQNTTSALVVRLDAGRVPPSISRYSRDELASLPEPPYSAISAPC